jgi:hypothetical protein
MRLGGHVVHETDDNLVQDFVKKKLKDRDHVEDLSVYGKIILE